MKVVIAALCVVVLLALAAAWGVPMLFKNKLVGKLIDAELLTDAANRTTVAVLTDGSWSYLSKSTVAGRTSQGRKGLFCKTHLFWYDPVKRAVLTHETTPYKQLPPRSIILHLGDALWQIAVEPDYQPLTVSAFRPDNGSPLMDTAQFTQRFALAGQTIRRQSLRPYPPYFLTFATETGREIVVDLQSGRSGGEITELVPKEASGTIDLFALADPAGGEQRRLYRLSNGDGRLYRFNVPQSAYSDLQYFERNFNARAEEINTAAPFIAGLLIYQDDEIAVILHQDLAGPDSPRRITCVDTTGRTRWSLSQELLFNGLRLQTKAPFSVNAFVQDRLRIKRSGGTMLIVFAPEGFMAVQSESGKVIWRYDF